jgi:hypothetical protein
MAMIKKLDTVEKAEKFVSDLFDSVELNVVDEYIRIQDGNNKLQDILNFSIPALETCPFKTDLCALNCYVLNAYNRYKEHVMKSHKANYAVTQKAEFVELMIAEIERQLKRPSLKDKHVTFRIHVSGDFYSTKYFSKWVAITDHFKGRNISFGCYTKSLPFIKSFMKNYNRTLDSININFMSSIWSDTKQKFVSMTEELGMNIFTAFDAKNEELPEGYIRCQDDVEEKACGRTCNLCYEKDTKKLLSDKQNAIIEAAFGRKKVAIGIH